MTEIPDESLSQLWSIRLMAWFTVSWFFCLGACLGSFLNVLVWRWPLGRSVMREPSACPVCGTRILWHDNLPIIGWLRLRGRCRACGVSIPLRYPLVEALVGVQFVVLLCAEALTGGATLPLRPIDQYAGVVWIIWYAMQPDLLRIYAWHLALLYLANIVWLIDEDRQRVPWTVWPTVLVVGLICLVGFPNLHPTLNLQIPYDQPFTWAQRRLGLISGSIGWLTGMLLGFCMVSPLTKIRLGILRSPYPMLLGCAGLALGWEAVISTGLIATMIGLCVAMIRGLLGSSRQTSPVFALWLALPIQLLAWRWLNALMWWPGSRTSWPMMAAAIVATLSLGQILVFLGGERHTDFDPTKAGEATPDLATATAEASADSIADGLESRDPALAPSADLQVSSDADEPSTGLRD